MKGVITPNGVEYISTPDDAADLINQYVGYDLAEYCRERMREVDEVKLLTEAKAETDYAAAEEEVEHYRDMLFEIKSVIEQMMVEDFEKAKRLNKDKVYNKLYSIAEDIQKNL